jgi:hypothetical protein
MKVIMKFKQTILVFILVSFSMKSSTAMFLLSRVNSTRLIGVTTAKRTISQQRRFLYNPAQLKGLCSILRSDKRRLSPVHGASFAHSPYLRNFYAFGNTNNPLVRLVNDPKIGLFYKQEDQFRPSQLKSNPTYSLTPSILGHVIGTLETGKFDDKKSQESLVTTWRAEHKKLCDGYANTAQKYVDFLSLLRMGARANEPHARSLLLGYLNSRASTKQDMLNYLTTLNQYTPIFSTAMPPHFSTDHFTVKDRVRDISELDLADETDAGATNYEKTIFTLASTLDQKNPYPPQVIQGSVRFKGKPAVANCVETAFLDLYNIILYDHRIGAFDLGLLPAHIKPKAELVEFYQKICTLDTVNKELVSQEFMNMVSGIKSIQYCNDKNYELETNSENFLNLTNHLLCIKAQDYSELSRILSDSRRMITFTKKNESLNTTIMIVIIDNNTEQVKHAQLELSSDHGSLSVPARNIVDEHQDPVHALLWEKITLKQTAHAQDKAHSIATLVAPRNLLPSRFIEDPLVLHNVLYAMQIPNDPRKLSYAIQGLIDWKFSHKPFWNSIKEDCHVLLARLDECVTGEIRSYSISRVIASILNAKAHLHDPAFSAYCVKHALATTHVWAYYFSELDDNFIKQVLSSVNKEYLDFGQIIRLISKTKKNNLIPFLKESGLIDINKIEVGIWSMVPEFTPFEDAKKFTDIEFLKTLLEM